jgi:hypothetical protein
MVRVATAANGFEGRIIAARLGAEGLLWELRGNVDGPFAIGPVDVLVAEDDAGVACELLLADEVEAAFDDLEPGERTEPAGRPWLLIAMVGLAVLFALARIAALG